MSSSTYIPGDYSQFELAPVLPDLEFETSGNPRFPPRQTPIARAATTCEPLPDTIQRVAPDEPMLRPSQAPDLDIESAPFTKSSNHYLQNNSVSDLSFSDVSITVPHRKTKRPVSLLSSVSGHVKSGELLAIMGPSGSGKTTLLHALARRKQAPKSTLSGTMTISGRSNIDDAQFCALSTYVEQEDALIGSLTARETLDFTAKLSFPPHIRKRSRIQQVDSVLAAFGLAEQSDLLVGTPLRKGLSGGQKRRLSSACAVLSGSSILFLDEPTSGLDSVASYESIVRLKQVAQRHGLLVVCSIHQPSMSTLALFDLLLLLSQGKTCYFGATSRVQAHFEKLLGRTLPSGISTAEWILDLTNVDFAADKRVAQHNLDAIHHATAQRSHTPSQLPMTSRTAPIQHAPAKRTLFRTAIILLHRSFTKSHRDITVYGLRLMMYLGLALMMGTVWLRLASIQSAIQPFINAIFFGSAFMSFMAVAYVPAYLEDLATFRKDRANGLYTALPFLLSNAVLGVPYLFSIGLVFSLITYWLTGFSSTGGQFWRWVMWLFLDLLAAESLVVLVTSAFPIFVLSLAIVAFANGLFMAVGGFLIPLPQLNVFYKYVFSYIDYQRWVFENMMKNEFGGTRTYSCEYGCRCMYPPVNEGACQIAGTEVLNAYGYTNDGAGRYVAIMLAIIVAYRIAGWAVLASKR